MTKKENNSEENDSGMRKASTSILNYMFVPLYSIIDKIATKTKKNYPVNFIFFYLY